MTRMPSLRPSKRFGPFSMMLSAGDGSRSWRVGTAASAGFGIACKPELLADLVGQRLVDVEQMRDHPLADDRRLHLAQFEGQRGGDVVLLGRGLADEELPRLAVVVGKAFRAQANLGAFLDIGERSETALGRFPRPFAERVRLVVHAPDRDCAWPCGRPAGNGRTGISAR